MYGPNLINVPVKGVLELLVLEVLNPFYIFQVASIGIWCVIEYYYFAGAIAIMSAAGIVITIVQTRRVTLYFLLCLAFLLTFIGFYVVLLGFNGFS